MLSNNDKLIIIDMVNGFAHQGALSSPNVAKLIPNIRNLVQESINNNVEIIHYIDSHPQDAREFDTYPPHCIAGTVEANIVEELIFPEIEVVEKNSTNAFLAKNPFENNIKNLYIVGCVSDICILDFAHTAIKYVHEYNLDVSINVIENLCATFDAPNHNSIEIHKQSMDKLKADGVNIISI